MKQIFIPIILLVIFFVFLVAYFHLEIKTKNKEYKVYYNGFVWVVLDYYSIQKFKSNDKPMKLIVFKINKANPK